MHECGRPADPAHGKSVGPIGRQGGWDAALPLLSSGRMNDNLGCSAGGVYQAGAIGGGASGSSGGVWEGSAATHPALQRVLFHKAPTCVLNCCGAR